MKPKALIKGSRWIVIRVIIFYLRVSAKLKSIVGEKNSEIYRKIILWNRVVKMKNYKMANRIKIKKNNRMK
jgi:hypothetical protein